MRDSDEGANRRADGRPLAVDPSAVSTASVEPAFIVPTEGAPVYHGFQVLEDIAVDGFVFGKITDFEAEPCAEGDAFVIAPDNSRAGLVWDVGEAISVSEVLRLNLLGGEFGACGFRTR
jgi:hypothetical protein